MALSAVLPLPISSLEAEAVMAQAARPGSGRLSRRLGDRSVRSANRGRRIQTGPRGEGGSEEQQGGSEGK